MRHTTGWMELERLSDEELPVLARTAPGAFGTFYRRHVQDAPIVGPPCNVRRGISS